jgi:GntR family transcriptional repressor for pyruvate dehydrogenase complex
MATSLAPVRRGLADQLVERLVEAVARGDYPPDSRLPPEAELAEQCDVSRLTLREAIKALRNKGVVRVEQGRGTFVNPRSRWSPLDPTLLSARLSHASDAVELAWQLTEARRLVELGVAELAAERHSPEDLAALQDAVDRMRLADGADNVDEFAAADIDFHNALNAAAGNLFVAALFEPIEALVRLVRRETSMVLSTRADGIERHADIIKAVASGSPQAARDAMIGHFQNTDQTLREAIREGHLAGGPPAAAAGTKRRAPRRTKAAGA